jgi:hypothetical protein
MRVTLPKPKQAYDYTNEVEFRRVLEIAISDLLAKREDITIQPNQRVIFTSPGGNKFYITVDDAGVPGMAAL